MAFYGKLYLNKVIKRYFFCRGKISNFVMKELSGTVLIK